MNNPNGVHHLAISTTRMRDQLEFFTDVLGAELKALYWMHGIEGTFHGFVKLNDFCSIAFVQGPKVSDAAPNRNAGGAMQHVAFNVKSYDDLLGMRDRIRDRGLNVFGPVDHGFCRSIYFAGLEGMMLEIATSEVALDERAWIDPEVVELVGIDAAMLERLKWPATFESQGGAIVNPPVDWSRPQIPYMSKEEVEALMSKPDAQVMAELAQPDPPVKVDERERALIVVTDPQVIPGTPANCIRVPYVVGFTDNPNISSEVYAGSGALIGLDCHLIKTVESEADTLIVFMHPVGGGMYLPIVRGLAAAGHHVLWANSRYRGIDAALIMERVACDLGEAILDAKTRLGYSKIVLAGMSGGGSVAMWYQALAEAGDGISDTAAGDVYVVDPARMPAADAIVMLVTHVGRHTLITEWMDASIRDEARPHDRDPELNLYDPANPNQPPYSADFLATYTAAQLERNRRITSWAKSKLEAIRDSNDPHRELAFVVHGTAADPRWVDGTVDPSDREPGTYYLGDPRLVNDGPVGLGRFCTLRSWISQWSYDDARADAEVAGADVSVPVLVLGATADNCCAPSHSARIYAGVAHERKQLHMVNGAMHFFNNPDSTRYLDEAVSVIGDFIHGYLD